MTHNDRSEILAGVKNKLLFFDGSHCVFGEPKPELIAAIVQRLINGECLRNSIAAANLSLGDRPTIKAVAAEFLEIDTRIFKESA